MEQEREETPVNSFAGSESGSSEKPKFSQVQKPKVEVKESDKNLQEINLSGEKRLKIHPIRFHIFKELPKSDYDKVRLQGPLLSGSLGTSLQSFHNSNPERIFKTSAEDSGTYRDSVIVTNTPTFVYNQSPDQSSEVSLSSDLGEIPTGQGHDWPTLKSNTTDLRLSDIVSPVSTPGWSSPPEHVVSSGTEKHESLQTERNKLIQDRPVSTLTDPEGLTSMLDKRMTASKTALHSLSHLPDLEAWSKQWPVSFCSKNIFSPMLLQIGQRSFPSTSKTRNKLWKYDQNSSTSTDTRQQNQPNLSPDLRESGTIKPPKMPWLVEEPETDYSGFNPSSFVSSTAGESSLPEHTLSSSTEKHDPSQTEIHELIQDRPVFTFTNHEGLASMSGRQMTAAKTASGVGVGRQKQGQVPRVSSSDSNPFSHPPDQEPWPKYRKYQQLPVDSQGEGTGGFFYLPETEHHEGRRHNQQFTGSSESSSQFFYNWRKKKDPNRGNQFGEMVLRPTLHFGKGANYDGSSLPGCIPKQRGSGEYPPLSSRWGAAYSMLEGSHVGGPLTKPSPTAHPGTQYTSASSPRTNLESESDNLLMDCEQGAAATAVICSVSNILPPSSQISTFSSGPDCSERVSGSFPRSHSSLSLSHMTSAEGQTLTRARSLPELLLNTSYEQFTPDISTNGEDETYRFHCSRSGLYQCIVTGLLFQMEREGDVVYGTVPWDRKLLSQHHKQPAGPLFEISCEQQSVCQLHLPHCEIHSTGGAQHLSVAHVNEEGVEFIIPHKITETHLIINISSFSAFGNVKDEDSPSVPIRALVLLFYRPPVDPDPSSILNVLLLPKNVVLRDVQRIRKKTVGDERYIETSPHCKLHPQQDYTLSTCPEDSSVLVEPTTAEFDSEDYDNYFPSFQVTLEQTMKHIQLSLKHTSSSISVWDRRVCLQSSGLQRSCGQSALNLPPSQRLLDIRSSFIEGVSGPVLKSLLDKLLKKKVMVESEWESADGVLNKSDKARFVIDTVRKKGEAASSEMMEALCEIDLFLSEHLGLI